VLWRVLGKGVPGEDDVLVEKDAATFNKEKYANGDDFTPETEEEKVEYKDAERRRKIRISR